MVENPFKRKKRNRHPIFFLNIVLPIEKVDITHEPTKSLVAFEDENAVSELIKQALQIFMKKNDLYVDPTPYHMVLPELTRRRASRSVSSVSTRHSPNKSVTSLNQFSFGSGSSLPSKSAAALPHQRQMQISMVSEQNPCISRDDLVDTSRTVTIFKSAAKGSATNVRNSSCAAMGHQLPISSSQTQSVRKGVPDWTAEEYATNRATSRLHEFLSKHSAEIGSKKLNKTDTAPYSRSICVTINTTGELKRSATDIQRKKHSNLQNDSADDISESFDCACTVEKHAHIYTCNLVHRLDMETTEPYQDTVISLQTRSVQRGLRTCLLQRFDNSSFQNFQVLGQVDNKFVACTFQDNSPSEAVFIVLIDQHAAHERIRLEKMEEEYFGISCNGRTGHAVALIDPFELRLATSDAQTAEQFKQSLSVWGIGLVRSAFGCRYLNSHSLCRQQLLVNRTTVDELIESEITFLRDNAGRRRWSIPPTLQDILNTRACHGAIRFGDTLSITHCKNLIRELSECKLPFQCAHGRPSIAPLFDVAPTLSAKAGTALHKEYTKIAPNLKAWAQTRRRLLGI
eukprot:gene3381-6037_t